METDDQGEIPSQAVSHTVAAEKSLSEQREASLSSKWWSTLRWRAHCLLPNLLPNPYSADEIEWAIRDEHENRDTQVRLDRELRCKMIWGVELYGPTEIDALYAGLTSLGWMRVGASSPKNAAVNRVRQMRSRGGGAWLNLGRVNRRGQHGAPLMISNFAPLPPGVEFLLVSVHQITPSVTAVLIGFQLEEILARRYEIELNTDRSTIRRRIYRTWSVEWAEPVHQKIEAVALVRAQLRAMVGNWFARHIPGYFCELNRPANFPTMELLVAQGLQLRDLDSPVPQAWRGWRRSLFATHPHEVWSGDNYPGLQLAFERHDGEDTGLHLQLALDPKTFSAGAEHGIDGSEPRNYCWLCNDLLGGTLVHGATIEYLKIHGRGLHRTRERMKQARSSKRHIARTLDEIGAFFDQTLGAPAVFRELAKHSKDPSWYRRDCAEFTTLGWGQSDKPRELPEAIRATVQRESMQLTEDETVLRGHFEQLASILSVRESIRAQHWMFALTIFALVVALASLVVAFQTIPNHKAVLQSLIASMGRISLLSDIYLLAR